MSSILKVDEIQNTDGKTGIVITPDGSLESVKFPEQSNPSGRVITSTTMSSYETGTWTPVLTNNGGDWIGASGLYTKVGNTVTINFNFDAGGGDAGFYTGGNISLTSASLPFDPSKNAYYAIPLYDAFGADATQKGTYGIFLRSSGDNPLRYFRDGSASEHLSGDDLGVRAVIQSAITYFTDE